MFWMGCWLLSSWGWGVNGEFEEFDKGELTTPHVAARFGGAGDAIGWDDRCC